MKTPSLAKIRVLNKGSGGFLDGNPAMKIRLDNGTEIDAFKQGGMNLWAFPERGQYSREWLDLFDRRMTELWDESPQPEEGAKA